MPAPSGESLRVYAFRLPPESARVGPLELGVLAYDGSLLPESTLEGGPEGHGAGTVDDDAFLPLQLLRRKDCRGDAAEPASCCVSERLVAVDV